MQKVGRRFIFVVNDVNQEIVETPDFVFPPEVVKFAVWQLEKGDHIHVQGYIEFKKVMTLKQVKEIFAPFKPHIENAKGSKKQNVDYCTKEDTRLDVPKYVGDLDEKGQGARTDLKKTVKRIRDGASLKDLVDNDEDAVNVVKYAKGLTLVQRLVTPSKLRNVKVTVLFGPTETGKTEYATGLSKGMDENDALKVMENVFKKQCANKWFCGYTNQKKLVLDEYSGWLDYDLLKGICDVYPLVVETKGGDVAAHWDEVIITSNKWPEYWHPGEYFAAFKRRVHCWIFSAKNVPKVLYDDFDLFKRNHKPKVGSYAE